MPDCRANSKGARRFSNATIVVTLCLGALAGEADAQLYKWVDEKGRTQYSDKPQAGQKTREMKIQAPPGAGTPDVPGKAQNALSPQAPDVPASIGYRLEGDALIFSVSSGLIAGEHTLRRK